MPKPFVILHLSDAHIGKSVEGVDETVVLDALYKSIKEEFIDNDLRPDLIVFSGDLVQGCKKEGCTGKNCINGDTNPNCILEKQYAKAKLFIEEIASNSGATPGETPFLFVPGNHDVNRHLVTEEQETARDHYDRKTVTKKQEKAGLSWNRIINRQKRWYDFVKNEIPYPSCVEWNDTFHVSSCNFEHDDIKIGFIGLNTSWAASNDYDRDKLWIGKHQYYSQRDKIKDADFKIVATHHPCRWLHPDETCTGQQNIQSYFDLHLQGHEHLGWIDDIRNHLRVEGGATYADTEAAEEEKVYSWIVIDFSKKTCEVNLRKLNMKGEEEWQPLKISKVSDKNGKAEIKALFIDWDKSSSSKPDSSEDPHIPISLRTFVAKQLTRSYSFEQPFENVDDLKVDLDKSLLVLSKVFCELVSLEVIRKLPKKIKDVLQSPIEVVSKFILKNPQEALTCISTERFEIFFELNVAYLLQTNDPKRLETLLLEVIAIINYAYTSGRKELAFKAVIPAVESLVWALQSLDKEKNRPKAILFLQALAADEWPSDKESIGFKTLMSQLLQTGMYVEIFDFLKTHKNLPNSKKMKAKFGKKDICVLSMLSRKGGTGKSILSMIALLSYLKKNPDSKVCVIDMDYTGPTWQYLLFPEKEKPDEFLNDVVDMDGIVDKKFSFYSGKLASSFKKLLQSREINIPRGPKGKISLLTLRDLPRTNRQLQEAILSSGSNADTYKNFLREIIELLRRQRYSMVVIDNAPGFGIIPLIAHSIASSQSRGNTLLVSTPYLPDIRGTMIDLSDERLLYKDAPPIWIINKIGADMDEFSKKNKTLSELASATKAYHKILPERKIVNKMQQEVPCNYIQLQRDEGFWSFATVEDRSDGTDYDEQIAEMVKDVIKSELMKQFNRRVAPKLAIGPSKSISSVSPKKNTTKKKSRRKK